MELSILERLSEEEPRGRRYIRHNRDLGGIREWLKNHSSEIDEARSRGYSWKQITRACVKKWVTSGQFAGVYLRQDEDLLQDCYYEVKKETGKQPESVRTSKHWQLSTEQK